MLKRAYTYALRKLFPSMPKVGTVVRVQLSREEFANELYKQVGIHSTSEVDEKTGETYNLGFFKDDGTRCKFRKGMFAQVIEAHPTYSWVKIFGEIIKLSNKQIK